MHIHHTLQPREYFRMLAPPHGKICAGFDVDEAAFNCQSGVKSKLKFWMFSHHAFAKCQPVGRIWATGRMGSIRLLYSTAAFNRTRKARCNANTKLSLSLMPIQLQGEHNMNAASYGAFKIKVDLHLQYSTAMRIQVHHVYSTVSWRYVHTQHSTQLNYSSCWAACLQRAVELRSMH